MNLDKLLEAESSDVENVVQFSYGFVYRVVFFVKVCKLRYLNTSFEYSNKVIVLCDFQLLPMASFVFQQYICNIYLKIPFSVVSSLNHNVEN